jgi:hypothetical protein
MSYTLDASQLSPLEEAALLRARDKREDMDKTLTAAEVFEQFVKELFNRCVDLHVTEEAPKFIGYVPFFLNSTPEKQREALNAIGYMDPGRAGAGEQISK